MADRLTGIEVFVLAMRLGGLSAAARALHMSPWPPSIFPRSNSALALPSSTARPGASR
jgi:hypothetical protein